MKLSDNEVVLKKGGANHLVSFEGVGGRLFLTNQRLFFKSHFFNIQRHDESIALEDIVSIETPGEDWISKKMTIFLRNGSTENFLVNQRTNWAEEIEKAIRRLQKKKSVQIYKKTGHTVQRKPAGWYLKAIIRMILLSVCVSALIFLLMFCNS